MSSEDLLLLGVALIVAFNRLYAHTALVRVRAAYACVQGINLAACVFLFVERLDGISPRLDAGIRLFLSAFVTWHIATNYVAHGKRVREAQHQEHRAAIEEETAQELADMISCAPESEPRAESD